MTALTKIIETPKARVLVVGGLPEDASNFRIEIGFAGYSSRDVLLNYDMPNPGSEYSALGTEFLDTITDYNWQLLGKLSEITEEQWKGIVETHPVVGGFGYYKDTVPSFFNTASMAGLSLIESECLYYLNPIIFYEAK